MMPYGFGGFEMLIMLVMMLLVLGGFLLLVGLGIWALIRASRRSSGGTLSGVGTSRVGVDERPEDDALETLRRRYARGEITAEEYRIIREDLES